MPTGYTAPIDDGTDLSAKSFVTHCARAFGAFIHQRDEDIDSPPRLPEPFDEEQSWYAKSVKEDREDLAKLTAMTYDEIVEAYNDYVAETIDRYNEELRRYDEKMARYQSVREKVERWQPHPDAEPIKKFCLDQIDMSLPYKPSAPEIDGSPEEWWQNKIDMAAKSVARSLETLEDRRKQREDTIEYAKNVLKSIEDVED